MDLREFSTILNMDVNSIETQLLYVLYRVYVQSRIWEKAKNRDPLDIFQHRVLSASYQPTFRRFLDKLCRGLGIQGLKIESEVVDRLESESDRVLDMLRHESTVLVAKIGDILSRLRRRR